MHMKEPDFNSDEFDEKLEKKIEQVVAKYAFQLMRWLITAIIGCAVSVLGAAVWATKTYMKLDDLVSIVAKQEQATADRLIAWSNWRSDVDSHFRLIDNRTGDRWTRTSMRDYNNQMGYLNPTLKLPDPDIIANRQTTP